MFVRRVPKVDTSKIQRDSKQWRVALGKNVRGMRESLQMTEERLAQILCWRVETIRQLENGEIGLSRGQETDLMNWVRRTTSPS